MPRHQETNAFLGAPIDQVFAHIDDWSRVSSHMSRGSWMIGGGKMETELDEARGQRVGSRVRLAGRAFGVPLSLEETVTERDPPYHKTWETTSPPSLLVIGDYKMGFDIGPEGNGSRLRVFIDYELPEKGASRWLGRLFGDLYARWCTRQLVNDATRHFEQRG